MGSARIDKNILQSSLWKDVTGSRIFLAAILLAEPYETFKPTKTLEPENLTEGDFILPPGKYGLIDAASTGLLNSAQVTDKLGYPALRRLASPDKHSRTSDFEGRRLVRVSGGFVLLNFERYQKRGSTSAKRMAAMRARKAKGADVPKIKGTPEYDDGISYIEDLSYDSLSVDEPGIEEVTSHVTSRDVTLRVTDRNANSDNRSNVNAVVEEVTDGHETCCTEYKVQSKVQGKEGALGTPSESQESPSGQKPPSRKLTHETQVVLFVEQWNRVTSLIGRVDLIVNSIVLTRITPTLKELLSDRENCKCAGDALRYILSRKDFFGDPEQTQRLGITSLGKPQKDSTFPNKLQHYAALYRNNMAIEAQRKEVSSRFRAQKVEAQETAAAASTASPSSTPTSPPPTIPEASTPSWQAILETGSVLPLYRLRPKKDIPLFISITTPGMGGYVAPEALALRWKHVVDTWRAEADPGCDPDPRFIPAFHTWIDKGDYQLPCPSETRSVKPIVAKVSSRIPMSPEERERILEGLK